MAAKSKRLATTKRKSPHFKVAHAEDNPIKAEKETGERYQALLDQGKTGGGTGSINAGPSDTTSPDPNNPPGYPRPGNPSGLPNPPQEGLAPPRNVQQDSYKNPGTSLKLKRGKKGKAKKASRPAAGKSKAKSKRRR